MPTILVQRKRRTWYRHAKSPNCHSGRGVSVECFTVGDVTGAEKQWKTTMASVEAAQQALDEALAYQVSPDDAERLARVRALQAQAQLNLLCSISCDLSEIRDALPG